MSEPVWFETDDGRQGCRLHATTVDKGESCPSCAVGVVADKPPALGPNEIARNEALARGLPDGLEWERRVAADYAEVGEVLAFCRERWTECTARAKEILGGHIVLMQEVRVAGEAVQVPADADRSAREWLDTAGRWVDRFMKGKDVRAKDAKICAPNASMRDSDAEMDRRNREGHVAEQLRAGKGRGN